MNISSNVHHVEQLAHMGIQIIFCKKSTVLTNIFYTLMNQNQAQRFRWHDQKNHSIWSNEYK